MQLVRNSTLTVRIVTVALAVAFALSLMGAATTTYALTQSDIDVICAIVTCSADQKAALNALVSPSTGGSCPVLTQPLTVGSQGQAVTDLQTYLQGTGHFTFSGGATGYFGPITQSAVAAWQTANGVSPAAGYWGPISLAKYNSVCTPGTTTPPPPGTPPTTGGMEGGIVVTQEGSPSNGTDVKEGQTKVVSAFEVEADDESTMTVNRIDVNFSHRPWLYLESLALSCDGDLLAEEDGLSSSDFTEITSGSDYRWRAGGLDHMIPAGEEHRCEVEATALVGSDKSDTTITITHGVDSVRATDTAGIVHEEPNASFTRTFDFQDESAATLNWTLHTSEPDDAILVDVTDTGTTDNVVLCEFQIEAEQQDAFLNGIEVDFGGHNEADNVFDEVRLETADGTVLETATTVATTTEIHGIDPDLELPQDEKVHLRLVAKVKDLDDFTAGDAASTTIDASETDAQDDDFDSITGASLGSNITCEDRHFYKDAPIFTLTSTSITGVDDGAGSVKSANAEIKIKVTAQDADIYINNFANGGWIASTTPSAFGTTTGTFTSSDVTESGNQFKVSAGTSRNFTFTANIDNTTSGDGDGFVKLDTTSITYSTDTTIGDADDATFTFGLDDFETANIFLND